MTTAIVTPAQVAEITAQAVTSEDILAAQNIIEIFANRTFVAAALGTRDLAAVRQAVAYQAVWMNAHPEIFVATDTPKVSQVDYSVEFRDHRSQWLAPLARAAMRRASWMRSRSVSIRSTFASSSEITRPSGLVDSPNDQWERMDS